MGTRRPLVIKVMDGLKIKGSKGLRKLFNQWLTLSKGHKLSIGSLLEENLNYLSSYTKLWPQTIAKHDMIANLSTTYPKVNKVNR